VQIAFTFSGKTWAINPADFNLGRVGSGDMCLGAFFSLEEGSTLNDGEGGDDAPSWIIGDTFLKNVYSIFRYANPQAVGFAELSEVAKGLNDVPSSNTPVTQNNQVSATARSTRVCIGLTAISMTAGLLWL
jgi:cathepsin D